MTERFVPLPLVCTGPAIRALNIAFSMVSDDVVTGIADRYARMASGNVEVFSVTADPEG